MSRIWPLASVMGGATDGSSFTLGNGFHASIPGQITQLWYYRSQAAANGIPVNIKLWDVSSQALLASVDPSTSTAGTGWKAFNLATPVNVSAGQVLAITAYWPAGRQFSRVAAASKPTPETPLVFEANFARSNFGADAFPNTAGSATCEGVDITFNGTDVPDPNDTPNNFDIENALVRWFSSGDDNTRTGELPTLIYNAIQTALANLDTLSDGQGDLGSDLTTILTRTVGLTGGTIQAALNALDAALKGPSGTTMTGIETLVSAGAETADAILALLGQSSGGPGGLVEATDPGWTLVASGAFDGDFEVTERCDRVYVSIDTAASGDDVSTRLGHEYVARYYWWEPVFGSFGGTHQTQRNVQACLYVEGMRMDGARVYVGNGRQGTWEAWRFDG